MCKSIAEGGHRCNGRHLTRDQHANRAERRREADRARKAARKAATKDVSSPLPAIKCRVPRPFNIPDGYVHRDTLRKRPGGRTTENKLNRAGLKRRSEEEPDGLSVWWYPVEDIARMEATDPEVQAAINAAEVEAEARRAKAAPRTAKTAARADQRKADDEMAKAEGHPYGKDAEIRRLATPAARDKAAEGEPVFVRHGDEWKVLMPDDHAELSRIHGERFPVASKDGRESLQRVIDVERVGAHNGVLMALATVSATPGPDEQAEIDAEKARAAAEKAAAEAARQAQVARQRAAEKAQREAERNQARKSLTDKTVGDDLSWAGAINVQGVADGSRPPAVWSKDDRGEWVVVARASELEDKGHGIHQVGVHKRGQYDTQEFSGYVIGRAEVDGEKVAVLSKTDPSERESCYSCGGPGPLDEYGYCGC